jgi:hypothetical protein
MAALFWNSNIRELTPGTANIGTLKNVIEHTLREIGFADVRRNDLEVAGGKNGVWVSIAHFHIGDRRFWEVVMASGDALDATRNTSSEVADKLRGLVFFD